MYRPLWAISYSEIRRFPLPTAFCRELPQKNWDERRSKHPYSPPPLTYSCTDVDVHISLSTEIWAMRMRCVRTFCATVMCIGF